MRKILVASVTAALVAACLATTAPARAFAQNVACFFDQGGAGFHAGNGCTISIESGGTLAVKTPLYLGGNGAPGGAGVDGLLAKTVTAIANNTATDVLTVTVPNAAHSATIPIIINATLGAGGAVGANECTATAYGQIVLTRTAGLATVATATTLADTGSACVAGATTVTLAYSVTSMTGANSATQTFTVQVTIARGGGSSTNHVAVIQADILNANASGVTVS